MKQRVISSVVGLSVLAVVLLFYTTIVFNVAVGIISLLAVYEVLKPLNIKNKALKFVCFVFVALIPFLNITGIFSLLPIISFLFIILLFIILIFDHQAITIEQTSLCFFMSLIIPLSLSSEIYMRDSNDFLSGIFYLLISLGGAWLTDTGAYFIGVKFGKHKFSPTISPNKTIEGVVGGITVNLVLYVLIGMLFTYVCSLFGMTVDINYLLLIIAAPICSAFAILGDLSASLVKRHYKIKDFGHIMPGHGGVLDRFDSVFFVVPFFSIFVNYFPIITVA